MPTSILRLTATAFLGLVVVACAPAASPTPSIAPLRSGPPESASASTTPAPTATSALIPTPAPARPASGWPYTAAGDSEPVFGPDGTVYRLAPDARGPFRRIVALDSAGHEKRGWPIEASPGSIFGLLAVGSDGTVLVDECGVLEAGCTLHRFGEDGGEVAGWPYDMPAGFACPAADQCHATILDIDPNGTVYLTSRSTDDLRVIAIDHGGDLVPGWPIVLDDYDWSDLQVGPDGTLFAIRRPIGTPTYEPARGKIDELAELWAFGRNGKQRSGWPVSVPNVGGYLLGEQGDIVVRSLIDDIGELCPYPRRTLFTMLDLDGRTASGWPRGSTGLASSPVLSGDGTLYYISATHKLYAHDRAGDVKAGWPVPVPGAGDGCGPVSPYLAPDGTIYVVGDEVSALSSDGRPLPGWPYRPPAHVNAPCFDTECVGGPPASAISRDGTVYVLLHHTDPTGVRTEMIAIDRQGRLKAGWPYRVPFDANTVMVVPSVSPDGRLLIRGGDRLLALDPDGRISD